MTGKKISKGIIRVVYCAAVFVLSLVLMGRLLNRGNTDMTMEMADPMYPLLTLNLNGMDYNQMQGYITDMDSANMRDHLTPIGADRKIEFSIDKYGNTVEGISYQLRSQGEGRLIEDTKLYNYVDSENEITGEIVLKDLINSGAEYALRITLTLTGGKELYYYTHVIRDDGYVPAEMLEFVYFFSNMTFDERAEEELPVYLESNEQGDNTSFAHVDIHSSLYQVSWGDLGAERVTEPKAEIKEMDAESAVILMDYICSTGTEPVYYEVNEYFRIRKGNERMFLLDYKRDMSQILEVSKDPVINSKVILGINSTDINKKESNDGNRMAFVNARHLFVLDVTNNKLADVFGFYHKNIEDRRETSDDHGIRIIRVDEAGNVLFMVYGYMNCGINEGRMGIAVYYYDSTLNTVEERQFVSYDSCFEMLKYEVEGLSYSNSSGSTFVKLKDCIYEIKDNNIKVVAEGLKEEGFAASGSSRTAIWYEGDNLNAATELTLMDMQTGSKKKIKADAGEILRPLGFFEEDAIYGVAKRDDIRVDGAGHDIIPMYKLCIVNNANQIQKEYDGNGYYVTRAYYEDGMMRLKRVKKGPEGYEEAADDQILNNIPGAGGRNLIETVVTEKYETMVQIAIKNEIKTESLKITKPRQVLFEGERRADPENRKGGDSYLLYQYGKLSRVCGHAYEAIAIASAEIGTVRNAYGQMVYRRMTLPIKNQIMAIRGRKAASEGKDYKMAACLDEILKFEGVAEESIKSVAAGKDAEAVIEEMVENAECIDISGCDIDTVVYYIGNEKPVLLKDYEGRPVLLIGYNEVAIVIMDPDNGEVYKVSRSDMGDMAKSGGLEFLAYTIHEE